MGKLSSHFFIQAIAALALPLNEKYNEQINKLACTYKYMYYIMKREGADVTLIKSKS